jgi:AcrR family transcriptional regulator
MAANPDQFPLNLARQRIHAAAMKLFAERGATRVSISELATAAGMARGTIYSHVPDIDGLFEEVAAQLAHDMTERVVVGMSGVTDPAERLAIGVRQYIRRAHDEPVWGRFMSRFGLSPALMKELLTSDPLIDLNAGIASGRYRIQSEHLTAMISLIAGGTLAGMLPVLDGRSTWRDAGSATAELLLIALGLSGDEARALATAQLPPLPPRG